MAKKTGGNEVHKFYNPKTHEVFSNDPGRFCDQFQECDRGCPIFEVLNGELCCFWVLEHPDEAARLMGYKVVEYDPDFTPAKEATKVSKSKLAEILGVEEDEEFKYEWQVFGLEGEKYRIHNGKRQYFSDGWYDASAEVTLTEMIAHPEKIQRLPRWTEKDVEDAEATKRIVLANPYFVRRDSDNNIFILSPSESCITVLKESCFPSLKIGEKATLDEIIRAGSDE